MRLALLPIGWTRSELVTERVLKTHIDFETRSVAELAGPTAVGEHAYAQHESTDAILLAYKTPDMERPIVQNLLGDSDFPISLDLALLRGDRFVAHNARFEQAIWHWQMHVRHDWPLIERWSCTAARARYWGIRASLDGAGSDLEIAHEKNPRGKELINLFCKPRKWFGPKKRGIIKQPWAEPHELPKEWEEFKRYCGDDVLAEMDVDALLPELPEFEQRNWDLDYKMNWRGLPLDMEMVERAVIFCDHYTNMAFKRFDEITGGLRPTQRDRVLEYVQARELEIDNLRSKTLKRLNKADLEPELRECVDIRLETAQASVKKLQAMLRCCTTDGVARGLIMYYGAHTGRDSGKRVQPQNFKRGNKRSQKAMFTFLEGPWWTEPGNAPESAEQPRWAEVADLTFPRPLGALAESMRGFIKAPDGKRFVVADYAQIEARVLAWLARADRKLEAFRNGLDLYCQFASVLYNHPYETFFEVIDGKRKVKDIYGFERQISKSAELGCGFGLGGTTFVQYCDQSDIVIDEEFAKQVVRTWRSDNPEIVEYWARVEKAAKVAVWKEGSITRVGNITFHIHRIDEQRWWLVCTLPSGRHIAYYRPRNRDGFKWGNTPVTILSFRTEWNGRTVREDTYGGKLVENIVQGTARDVMKIGVHNAEQAGYEFIMPVHDEGIFLRDEGEGSHHELEQLMCQLPEWITDCPITAEGFECVRYTK
jgi:DNA polymerase